ncbi:hypothetical protein SAICODRAFT_8656 [Saitoella complicata NRRL Y-17804]|uniref:uncharacterized protein n=1 Tax=Saitoella complicata (strain BCRC 22490 / CBS 7301 / JCM 7358 / NBRC 10748 / NRRL Y-17804) TaxID=698492 RepID=UPI0008678E5B|nr:uncharacterized protein SAICODRAFT_8656 [Saitoella complicata NRRL Y-17804]ODQ51725.1 hypothetical protein SAICODRAFT_8656 [Saitoella complicata NRRL Y-17804]
MLQFLESLATRFDDPSIPWKQIIISISLAHHIFTTYLQARQYRTLCATNIPKPLQGVIDQETFDKSQKYSRAKAKFGFVSGWWSTVQDVGVMYFDVLPALWRVAGNLMAGYVPAKWQGEIWQSLLFVFIFNLGTTLTNLPISAYQTFVLEEKYGFNKQTPKIFITDILKSQLLFAAIGGPVLAAFLKIIHRFGDNFFYYLWLFFVIFQFVMIAIYPTLIQPLFNKLTPLSDGELKTKVEALASKLKFPLKHLYVIDGSKRSAHSNAYFYGLPWSKQIVIFDTLIEKSSVEEIVAVLGHELGHWGLSHTSKTLVITQGYLFTIFALFRVFIHNHSLLASFNFPLSTIVSPPVIISFLLFNDLFQPFDFVISVLMNVMSRKHEFQADAYAKNLGYGEELSKALIKLQVQNLSAMDADWMYSGVHHSHPILAERLRAVGWKGGKVQ